jgi:hypothetical protein
MHMTNVSSIGSADLAQLLSKTRTAAAGDFGVLSTGEKLAVALVGLHLIMRRPVE